MISRPPRRRGLRAVKAEHPKIELIDKDVDRADRIILIRPACARRRGAIIVDFVKSPPSPRMSPRWPFGDSESGRIFEVTRSTYPAGRFRYSIELHLERRT